MEPREKKKKKRQPRRNTRNSLDSTCLLRQTTSFFSTPSSVSPDPARGLAGKGEKNQFFYVVHSISSYCHPRVRGMKVVSEAVTPRETTRMNVLWIRTCKNRRLHPSGGVDRVSKEDRWMDMSPSAPPCTVHPFMTRFADFVKQRIKHFSYVNRLR